MKTVTFTPQDIANFIDTLIGVPLKRNLSDMIKEKFNCNFNYISNKFTRGMGKNIQKYYNEKRILKAKELLQAGQTLTEIAFQLQYSSVAQLSNQFKKSVGMNPTKWKESPAFSIPAGGFRAEDATARLGKPLEVEAVVEVKEGENMEKYAEAIKPEIESSNQPTFTE